MSQPIVSSVGAAGNYPDTKNDRFRGMVPEFVPSAESLANEWESFRAQARERRRPASRWTLRAVTTPDVVARAAEYGKVPLEAYIPLHAGAGLLYLATNSALRQPQLPVEQMREVVSKVETDVRARFRPPTERVAELAARGYEFTDRVSDPRSLHRLWRPTFGWTRRNIRNLRRMVEQDAQRNPADRSIWFTGVLHEGRLIAAGLAERLNVPGPDGELPTIESTEWVVDTPLRHRHTGVASAMLALNAAQCLQSLPTARILAECRYSSTAYAAGMSVGFTTHEVQGSPQIIARNVWIDGELADFVPVSLADEAVQEHYSPAARAQMLQHLN